MGKISAHAFQWVEDLFRIFLIVLVIRAVMLIVGVPFVKVPYLDAFLAFLWSIARMFLEMIANATKIF